MDGFKFTMIGAMYENGGNTTQRYLDGHPSLYVYPFESQIGTKITIDGYTSMFPVKYRFPSFYLEGNFATDYELIIDEECKVRTKTPHVSKFRHWDFDLSDKERKEIFLSNLDGQERNTVKIIESFYKSTFQAWKDFKASGKNEIYVGYSPIITVDADKLLDTFKDSHFIHVVRNPFSAYADTKKRPAPMSLKSYIEAWNVNQQAALIFKEIYPDRFHIIKFEDLAHDSKKALKEYCNAVGIDNNDDSLNYPSWNSNKMQDIYPWGTIREASDKVNVDTANELVIEEKAEIQKRTSLFIEKLKYNQFV